VPKQLRATSLESATARLRLSPRSKPYFTLVSPNVSLGYRRKQTGPGSWSVRCTESGADWVKKIGIADDHEASDGRHVFDYWGAVQLARQIARRQPGENEDDSRPLTIAEALDEYENDLKSRGRSPANAARVRKHLPGTLATKPVLLLNMRDLRSWRDGLVAKGMPSATINRTRAGLRAALELAAALDHRIENRDVFRLALKGLPGGKNARRIVLPDADVLRIVKAAYEEDRAFGLLIDTMAETGARVSQVARLRCADLQADRPDPRLLVPTSYKGRGEKQRQQVPVPITPRLAALLRAAKGDRRDDTPLLAKGDGLPWQATNRSEHWGIFRIIVERAGFDPDLITSYALRHSSICRSLLRGVPVSVVARLHDTSSREIEAHYAKYIADFADEVARRGLLLQPESRVGDNVVALVRG
jgi:integrase